MVFVSGIIQKTIKQSRVRTDVIWPIHAFHVKNVKFECLNLLLKHEKGKIFRKVIIFYSIEFFIVIIVTDRKCSVADNIVLATDGRRRVTEPHYNTSLPCEPSAPLSSKGQNLILQLTVGRKSKRFVFYLFFLFCFYFISLYHSRGAEMTGQLRLYGTCDAVHWTVSHLLQKKTRVVENMHTRQQYMSFWGVNFYWCKYLDNKPGKWL